MSGNFVIAGGSKGIGLELVRLLDSSTDRIDVYSRSIDELNISEKIKHHGHPKDLAALARFLLLSESSWITGQIIGVDGGLSALGA